MIPKDEYLREARGIKKTGFLLGGIASLALLFFCLIWNRKYTRPIQILMDQMEMVGKEQLDIENPEKVGWPEQEKAREELLALQYQINPHFLFNTLNTIAAFTRTDPAKARDLLREFSAFYRRTLQSSQSLIPLSEELEQTRRYLTIEKARFGEDRILESESVAPGCEKVMVPGFIVQPIVENAVRHAMRDEGPLTIDVQVVKDSNDVLIAVADDGLGMTEDVAERLLSGSSQDSSNSSRGTGIALRNVSERLQRFYGGDSSVEIMSKLGEGTCVTLRLAGVAPKETDGRIE